LGKQADISRKPLRRLFVLANDSYVSISYQILEAKALASRGYERHSISRFLTTVYRRDDVSGMLGRICGQFCGILMVAS
jgi:hypothetical protein